LTRPGNNHVRGLALVLAVVAGRVTTPKNGKTRRVDMSNQLTEALRVLLRVRKKETLATGSQRRDGIASGQHGGKVHLTVKGFIICPRRGPQS